MVGRIFVLVCLLLAAIRPSAGEELAGKASVHDGDTVTLHGTSIRLNGIDAPEAEQLCRGDDSLPYPCGQIATKALSEFLAGRDLNCVDLDDRSFARTIAVCSLGNTDIADWMVRNGYALDWPKYSKGGYAAAQAEAKLNGRGMWAGSFVEPWKYRACKRAGGKVGDCSDGPRP